LSEQIAFADETGGSNPSLHFKSFLLHAIDELVILVPYFAVELDAIFCQTQSLGPGITKR